MFELSANKFCDSLVWIYQVYGLVPRGCFGFMNGSSRHARAVCE